MIEIICNKDDSDKSEENPKDNNTCIRRPKNIKQIGDVSSDKKIYIEDYAFTYINSIAYNSPQEEQAGVLLGELAKEGNERCVFVKGVIKAALGDTSDTGIYFNENIWNKIYSDTEKYFPDLSVVGWFAVMPEVTDERMARLKKLHLDNFAGNMKGVKEKIPYLKECNINCLHLMPFLDTPKGRSDGGYAVADFCKVRPDLGTMKDLAELTEKCHEEDINVCMDFVMNHTSEDHEWARRARAGEGEYMSRYFFYDNEEIPEKYEKTVPQVFPTTAPGNFTYLPETGHYVMTTFYPYQWDLNYHNPKVFNEMIGNILYLANMGVEVFRIDAVPYIWKELGTNCRNLPQVHSIVRMLRMILEMVCPGVILKGEVVMEPKELPVYFGTEQEPECHMLYGVSSMVNLWAALATRDTRMLKHQMDVIHSLPKNCYFVNYLRCHDDIGWGLDEEQEKKLEIDPIQHKEYLYHFFEGTYPYSFARGELYNYDPVTKDARSCGTTASLCGIEKGGFEGDLEQVKQGIQRVLMMHAACMSMEGFVMLSSGDEIGQVNDYNYKKNPDTAADSRYLHRSPFQWENAEKRKKPGTVQYAIWNGLKQMEEFRREENCFGETAGISTWDTGNSSVFAIRRTAGREELICLANFSEYGQNAWLNCLEGEYEDLFTGEKLEMNSVWMNPYQYRWCVKK